MVTSFKRSHACTATLTAPNPAAGHTDPWLCWRLLDTHRQVWVSLLWVHCSFLLGPGAHKVLFGPSKSLFSQSCVSSGSSLMGLMVTSSKRTLAVPKSAAPRAPSLRQCTGFPLTRWLLLICKQQLFVTVHISPTAQRVPAVSSLWGFFGSHSQASLSSYIHRCLLSDLINTL